MNIFKRLQNLWILSAVDVSAKKEISPEVLINLFKEPDSAKVVDMHDPLSIDLGEEK